VTRAAVVAASSLLCGAITFLAQGFLPDAVNSFANSASGWTLVTVLLLTGVRAGPAAAALLGATSFVLLTVGYAGAAQLRGLHYDPTMFAVVGLVVGPFVGVATSWLRAVPSWRPALGTALLAGIGVGEASYGLTTVAGTTSPVYWWLIGAGCPCTARHDVAPPHPRGAVESVRRTRDISDSSGLPVGLPLDRMRILTGPDSA
jgi:hypothetical protein